jgi:hypothetical protein
MVFAKRRHVAQRLEQIFRFICTDFARSNHVHLVTYRRGFAVPSWSVLRVVLPSAKQEFPGISTSR